MSWLNAGPPGKGSDWATLFHFAMFGVTGKMFCCEGGYYLTSLGVFTALIVTFCVPTTTTSPRSSVLKETILIKALGITVSQDLRLTCSS